MDSFASLISSPVGSPSSPPFLSAPDMSNCKDAYLDPVIPLLQDKPDFQPLPISVVESIAEWRPLGLRKVQAPAPVDTAECEASQVAGVLTWACPLEAQLSTLTVNAAESDAEVASTSGRPHEQTSQAPAYLTPVTWQSRDSSTAEWAEIDSWRPAGLSPIKAPRPAVAPPLVEELCKQPVTVSYELPPALVQAMASFRPSGLTPIRVRTCADDSGADTDSRRDGSPQAPHGMDRANPSLFENQAQSADWRPMGLKPIRIRREALGESQNTPQAPKAAGANLRATFGIPDTDSPRAPPKSSELDDSLSPTIIPDVVHPRPALSPLRVASPLQPAGERSPRPQRSPFPSPQSGSPRLRSRDTVRLQRDLGPLSAFPSDGKLSGTSSGRSSPGTPRFKSQAQRKGLTIQSRLRRDDWDSNADSENTPPGSITPSLTPGATTPGGSPGPSPLAPSNRQRGAQAVRWSEKEAKKSGTESGGKEDGSRSVVQLLSGLPSLSALDRSALVDVAAAAKQQRYAAGETVVPQGAPVDSLLVVVRGSLAAWQAGAAVPLFQLHQGAACPHRLTAASSQGWAASMVAGEEGATCLLIPLLTVLKGGRVGQVDGAQEVAEGVC